MAEFIGKYLCPCLPLVNSSGRRSARSKVRALARKRHKNNPAGGPTSTSGVEDSVTITRNGSLTIFSISGVMDDGHGEGHNNPFGEALRDKADLPGVVPGDDQDETTKELKYSVADGTRVLSAETLMRIPQPSKAYVTNVRMRRLMKEFKAVTRITEEARRKEEEEKEQCPFDQKKTDLKEDASHEFGQSNDESQGECTGEKSEQESKNSDAMESNRTAEPSNQSDNKATSEKQEDTAGCSTSTEDKTKESSGESGEGEAEAVKKALSDGGFMTNERLSGPAYVVDLVNDSLADWNIKLYHINPKSALRKDMKKHNYEYILFNMTFPDNFPFAPPFVHVVSPHIEYGYVLDGGAICMELLTPQGWSSSYTIDAVIMQLGATLVAGDGRIVQTGYRSDVPFNKQEAEVSFRAIVETHERYGWHKTPGDNS